MSGILINFPLPWRACPPLAGGDEEEGEEIILLDALCPMGGVIHSEILD